MKIYITRLHVDIDCACCPDVVYGCFSNKEDAQKLVKHNFDSYYELWKDMPNFEVGNNTDNDRIITAKHAYFHSYIEEYICDANDILDEDKISDNKLTIYIHRPDIVTNLGVEKPVNVSYICWCDKTKSQNYIAEKFKTCVERTKDKPNFRISTDNEDRKCLYYEGCFASFNIEEGTLITDLDKITKE